ncbi:MAG: hypothetical protein WCB05_25385 [Candidatus Sulfotelmatobacter sp.]
MFKVAIVAALEREVRPLIKGWRLVQKEYDGRSFRFFEKENFVLVCGGVGGQAARRTAEAVIAMYQPAIVYSAGFAGALHASLKVGEIVRPGRVVNASDGSSVALNGSDGVLVSFASVASPAQKAKLRESFGARAVDMEAAAVAHAAEAHGIALGVVKAISDEVNFELPPMERFVDSEGRFSEGRFAWFAAVRPWIWARVFRLARNSGRASRALCVSLRELSVEPSLFPGRVHPPGSI